MTLDTTTDDVPIAPSSQGGGSPFPSARSAEERAVPAPVPFGLAPDLSSKGFLDYAVPVFIKRDSMAHASRRREYGIHGYCGPNGSGKSLAMVHDTLLTLSGGRQVLSTVRLLDYRSPRPCAAVPIALGVDDDHGHARWDANGCDDPAGHYVRRRAAVWNAESEVFDTVVHDTGRVHAAAHPLYVPLRNWAQLLTFSNGDVLLDEVTGVANSRDSASMPSEVGNLLVQLRRRDIQLRWSAPAWARADKILREVTFAVTDCRGHLAKQRQTEDGARMWRDRRLSVWRTFDTAAYEDWATDEGETAEPLMSQTFWRPGSVTERSYDTVDGVSAISTLNDAGNCLSCGGTRARRKCSCH